jgi:hypothetical protein
MSETSLVATRQGFAEAERTVRDYVCGDCGGVLVVLWRGDRYAAVCSRWPRRLIVDLANLQAASPTLAVPRSPG